MTSPPSLRSIVVSSSHSRHRNGSGNFFSKSDFDAVQRYRRWFRDMLWIAFPAQSDGERAGNAARVLDVSERQVRKWLKCENDPKLCYVMAVIAIAGAEVVLRDPDRS